MFRGKFSIKTEFIYLSCTWLSWVPGGRSEVTQRKGEEHGCCAVWSVDTKGRCEQE